MMNSSRGQRSFAVAFALGAGLCAAALGARSNFPQVGIVFEGSGSQPRSTTLEMLVGEQVKGNSAVCWLYTREGKPKSNAQVKGAIEILHQLDPDEKITLLSSLEYSPSLDNSIACGCGMMASPIEPGDVVRGDFNLKKVGKLKRDQNANLQLWVFDGVVIPGGQLTDCAAYFP